ncbi:hypothetical protein [Ligilactobacillus acidipiscis]|uniref:hypothetical protein n=1 Tax=Ligilactobacillus acidipiscis TaxID=89059 RepID=UPI0022E3F425|nr:hypothetical protein [Ligilactobacillus acidipiscis]
MKIDTKGYMDKVRNVKEIEESDYLVKNNWCTFIRNNWGWIVTTTMLAIIVLTQFFLHHNVSKLLHNFFFDEKGYFQWVGITALTAICSLLASVWITLKRNKADLVSKSRIEWIQKNKETISLYLRGVKFYPYLFNQWKIGKATQKEVDDLATEIEINYYLLVMNFSDNDDNKQINKSIEDCMFYVNSIQHFWNSNEKNQLNNYIPVANLAKVSRDYFKREWERAKKGK